jgi:hypothetical protein
VVIKRRLAKVGESRDRKNSNHEEYNSIKSNKSDTTATAAATTTTPTPAPHSSASFILFSHQSPIIMKGVEGGLVLGSTGVSSADASRWASEVTPCVVVEVEGVRVVRVVGQGSSVQSSDHCISPLTLLVHITTVV